VCGHPRDRQEHPFGILALAVLAVTLPSRDNRVRHAIDYAVVAVLAIALARAHLQEMCAD